MKFRRVAALAAAAVFCAGVFSGCGNGEREASSKEPVSSYVDTTDYNKEASLVLGGLALDSVREEALREIADKYEADFPNTEIEIRSFDSPEQLEAALREGRVDITEVSGDTQTAYVEENLLLDMSSYLEHWEEYETLTPGAKLITHFLGQDRAYMIPNDMRQVFFYYRTDWFNGHNDSVQDKADRALCQNWNQVAGYWNDEEWIPGAAEKLGDRGKLAFAGGETLAELFDTFVWSAVSLGGTAGAGAGYFTPGEDVESIFSLKNALSGAEQFVRMMEKVALPEAVNWTQDEAVQAFIDGRAGMLLADRSAVEVLKESMPEGTWKAEGFPRGLSGTAVLTPTSFTGWGISSGTQEPMIAFRFLSFLSNADNNTHYAAVCDVLPIHVDAADMEAALSEGSLAPELAMIEHSDWYQYVSPPVTLDAYEGYRELAEEKVLQLTKGGLSCEELMDFLNGYWNDAYQKEGGKLTQLLPE